MVSAGDRLVVYGGFDGLDERDDVAILFLPSTVWSSPIFMSEETPPPRALHSAVIMTDGENKNEMIVFGGSSDSATQVLGDVWVLDVLTLVWTKRFEGQFVKRHSHAALWLEDTRRMMVWGGSDVGGAEAVDPHIYFFSVDSGTWTVDVDAAGTLPGLQRRYGHTMHVLSKLPDGTIQTVLVVGGMLSQLDTAQDLLVFNLLSGQWTRQAVTLARSYQSPATWQNAADDCHNKQGHLLTRPLDAAEADMDLSLLRWVSNSDEDATASTLWWSGLHRRLGDWQWDAGEAFNTTHTMWAPGQGNLSMDDSMAFNTGPAGRRHNASVDGPIGLWYQISDQVPLPYPCDLTEAYELPAFHQAFTYDDINTVIILREGMFEMLYLNGMRIVRLSPQVQEGAIVPPEGLNNPAWAFDAVSSHMVVWGGLEDYRSNRNSQVYYLSVELQTDGFNPIWKKAINDQMWGVHGDTFSMAGTASYFPQKQAILQYGGVPADLSLPALPSVYALDTHTLLFPVSLPWTNLTNWQEYNPYLWSAFHSAVVFEDALIIFGGTIYPLAARANPYNASLWTRTSAVRVLRIDELATPAWGQATTFGDTPPPVAGHSAVLLTLNNEPHMFVFGGTVGDRDPLQFWQALDADYSDRMFSVELQTGHWTEHVRQVGALWPSARVLHCAVSLGGGNMLVWGGIGAGTAATQDRAVWIYNAESGTWTKPIVEGAPPGPRTGFGHAVVGSVLFLHGGASSQGLLNDLFRLELREEPMRWTRQVVQGISPHFFHAMVAAGSRIFTFSAEAEGSDVLWTGQHARYPHVNGSNLNCNLEDTYPCRDLSFAIHRFSAPASDSFLNNDLPNQYVIDEGSSVLSTRLLISTPLYLMSRSFLEGTGTGNAEVTCELEGDCIQFGTNDDRFSLFAGISLHGSTNSQMSRGMRVSLSNLRVRDVRISGFSGIDGVGMQVDTQSQVVGRNLVLDNNRAVSSGAGMSVSSSTITLQHSAIINNIANGTASTYGAGVALILGNFDATDVLFHNNIAMRKEGGISYGGALTSTSSTLNFEGVVFSDNSAGVGGAVAMASAASSHFQHTNFSGNSAAQGGAIWSDSAIGVRLTDCVLDKNSVVPHEALPPRSLYTKHNGGGGAVFAQDSPLQLTRTIVRGNRAEQGPGGGLLLVQSRGSRMEDCDFVDNVCTTEGGGALLWIGDQSHEPILDDTRMEGNWAVYGPDEATPAVFLVVDNKAQLDDVPQVAGQPLSPAPKLKLVDAYNQTVTSDSVTTVTVLPTLSFSAGVVAAAEQGVIVFDDLRAAVPPDTPFLATFQCTSRSGQPLLATEVIRVYTDKCQPGSFHDLPRKECKACAAGHYTDAANTLEECVLCNKGTRSGPGARSCVPCLNGSVATQRGMGDCTYCFPGTYEAGRNIDCQPCPAGTSGARSGMSMCLDCPEGRVSEGGAVECAVCAAGEYAHGSSECLGCPEGTFNPGPGATSCEACPIGRFADGNGTSSCRECSTGFYSRRTGTTKCSQCLEGMECNDGFGAIKSGYWALYDEDNAIQLLSRCPSGLCTLEDSCGVNRLEPRENPLCGACVEGHVEWGGDCVPCRESHGGFIFLFLIISLIYVLLLHFRSQRTGTGEAKVVLYYISTARFLAARDLPSLGFMGIFDFSPEAATGKACILSVDPYSKFGLKTLVPLLFMAMLLLTMFVAFIISKLRGTAFSKSPFMRTAFSLVIFSTTVLADVIFRYLKCVDVGPHRVVESAPALFCTSNSYQAWIPLMAIVLMLVAAAPVFVAVFLRIKKSRLEDPAFMAFAGVLYECYSVQCYWWEVIGLLRRIFLPLLAILPYADLVTRAQVLGCFNVVVLLAHIMAKPFRDDAINTAETISLSLLCVISVVKTSDQLDGTKAALVTTLVIVPVVLFVLCFVLIRFAPFQRLIGLESTKSVRACTEEDAMGNGITEMLPVENALVVSDSVSAEHAAGGSSENPKAVSVDHTSDPASTASREEAV